MKRLVDYYLLEHSYIFPAAANSQTRMDKQHLQASLTKGTQCGPLMRLMAANHT